MPLSVNSRLAAPALLLSLGLAILALFLFARLAEDVVEGKTRQFDQSVREHLHALATPTLTQEMRALTQMGSLAFLLPASLLTAGLLWTAGRRRRATFLLLTLLGGLCLLGVLKFAFHRPRPTPYFDTPLPSSYSFPSGHSLLSACFYGVAATFATVHERRRAYRWLIRVSAALLVLGIGLSRIYLGVHYPSDVLAGYLAALIWVLGTTMAYLRVYHRSGPPDPAAR